jgi:putative spermidine/putrescine transport system ATP-binding protein
MSVDLKLEAVRVSYGKTEILHGVSLDIRRGEFVTLLGPSGSGKTTTLNVVAGLVPITAGHVRFDGQAVEQRPPHARDIGLVFQSYALFPHMTVGENLSFGLRTRKVPRSQWGPTIDRMLELVQLPGTAERSIASLSGGQQQRIALARALAPSPSVLLLDEPMAALDKQLRETMQIELKRIHQEVGVTTVAVTHDQTEAMTMSDRVAIMRDGHLEQIDTPENLYRRPATLFAARFLGETNLISVEDGRLRDFGVPVPVRSGTAVLRPEDFALAAELGSGVPSISVRVITASYQGSRYRLDVDRGAGQEPMIVTLPPTTPGASIAPGATLELALRSADGLHVVAEEASSEPPLIAADIVANSAA